MQTLQQSFPGGTQVQRNIECTMNRPTPKSLPTVGVDQGCPLSACGFSAVVDPTLRSIMAELCILYDSGAKLFAYLDDWYLWIKP